jgi:transglutaminase-like putative cysteine protease
MEGETGVIDRATVAFRVMTGTVIAHVDVVVLTALSVAAVTPFGRLFLDNSFLLLPAGAAVLAATVSLSFVRRHLVTSLAVSVLAIAAYLAFVSFHIGAPTPTALRAVWDAVTASWSGLLTASVPAVSSARLTALPVLIAWSATVAAAELSLRTRSSVAPVVAPLAGFTVALAFTGKRPVGSLALPMLVVALLLLAVFVRANGLSGGPRPLSMGSAMPAPAAARRSPTVVRTHAGFGLAALAVVALAAAGVGAILPATPDSRRFDLHNSYHPPVQLSESVSPLAQVRSQLNDSSTTPIFSVRLTGIPAGMMIDKIPVAILDEYDGAVWGTSAVFAQVGHQLPPGPEPNLPLVMVHQDYQLNNYPSNFLPALQRPRVLDANRAAFDRISGMVVTSTPPPARYHYTVESAVADQSQVAKRPVKAGNDPSVAALASPPPGMAQWPTPILDFARSLPSNPADSYATLTAISDELRSNHFGYRIAARPGHSLGVIDDFLTALTGEGASSTTRVGYDEQFAAAFAIVARADNLPSRVVVGYGIDPKRAARGQTIEVRPYDVEAWAEVNLNGIGWVRFDPTNRTPRKPQAPQTTKTTPPTSQATTPTSVGIGRGSNPHLPGAGRRHHSAPRWPWILLAVVVALPTAVAAAKKVRRSRRQGNGPPTQRVMGAWLESRDQLHSHGMAVPVSMTVNEIAEACAATLDNDTAARVAAFGPLVDIALYDPEEPGEELATAAWELHADLVETLSAHASAVQRLRAGIDPRPLLPRRRPAAISSAMFPGRGRPGSGELVDTIRGREG